MQAHKTFLEILSTYDLYNKSLVESNPEASTLLTSTTPIASTTVNEEKREHLFHTHIWVQNNLLHLIVNNGIQKNFVSEDLVKKLDIVTNRHPQPYNIS